MAHKCVISGVSRQHGHRVSHANNKSKHVFRANLQTKKIFIPSLGKALKLKVSARMVKTIDKLGIETALRKFGVSLAELQ